ncbi:MAG: DUF1788 domain-containing protein [Candidatus Desulfofervidaceae bacterium]|nr:DUF1788 domain-containing protein [Candidatus Desulfofervidaceae bacterium]
MLSLSERLEKLEQDLLADPPRISAYHDLPFAIFHYPPKDEFRMRKQIKLLVTRLSNVGKSVHVISLARILWQIIEETEGLSAIVQEEKELGFLRAQETVNILLSDEDFMPIAGELSKRLLELKPKKDLVFLVRVGALGPAIYRSAKLLDEMHKKRILVPIILFYPGTCEGERNLRFLDLPTRENAGGYSYRVKIY